MVHVKQISANEIYLLIKYIKSVLWRVVKLLSQYTGRTVPKDLIVWHFNYLCNIYQVMSKFRANLTPTFCKYFETSSARRREVPAGKPDAARTHSTGSIPRWIRRLSNCWRSLADFCATRPLPSPSAPCFKDDVSQFRNEQPNLQRILHETSSSVAVERSHRNLPLIYLTFRFLYAFFHSYNLYWKVRGFNL